MYSIFIVYDLYSLNQLVTWLLQEFMSNETFQVCRVWRLDKNAGDE